MSPEVDTTIVTFLFSCAIIYGQEQIRKQDLGSFTEIKAFDGISITLIKADENKALISGENINKVAIVNKDGALKIRMKIDKIFSGFRTFVELYHTEELLVIDANEDALISSEDVFIQDILELKAQEGGEVNLNCQTEQLLVKSVTGGNINVTGFSKNQDVKINTGGSYDGKTFKTEFTTITVSAGGEAEIYATEYVKANVKAGGNIKVYGDPKKMDEKKVFGGIIERIN